MLLRRGWAYLLAVAAVLCFSFGLWLTIEQPQADCGDAPAGPCRDGALDRLRLGIVGSWSLAVLLLGCAIFVLLWVKKNPPPPRPPKERPSRPATPSITKDGRRVLSADQPPRR